MCLFIMSRGNRMFQREGVDSWERAQSFDVVSFS